MLDDLPHIDMAMLDDLRLVMGEDYSSLLQAFVEDSTRKIAQMRVACSGRDMELLRMTAHSLKGSSSNIGAARLSFMCKQMEDHARSGQLEPCLPWMDRAAEEQGHVITLLRGL